MRKEKERWRVRIYWGRKKEGKNWVRHSEKRRFRGYMAMSIHVHKGENIGGDWVSGCVGGEWVVSGWLGM